MAMDQLINLLVVTGLPLDMTSSSSGQSKAAPEEDTPYGSSGQKGTITLNFLGLREQWINFSRMCNSPFVNQVSFQLHFGIQSMEKPWHGSAHYSVGSSAQTKVGSGISSNVVSAFALILSVIAFCVSVFIGYAMTRNNDTVPFIPMDRL